MIPNDQRFRCPASFTERHPVPRVALNTRSAMALLEVSRDFRNEDFRYSPDPIAIPLRIKLVV